MADIILTITDTRLREIFNESTWDEEEPTNEDFEMYLSYLKENPEDAFKGMMMDFWCQNG